MPIGLKRVTPAGWGVEFAFKNDKEQKRSFAPPRMTTLRKRFIPGEAKDLIHVWVWAQNQPSYPSLYL